jgi:hypothetical protein
MQSVGMTDREIVEAGMRIYEERLKDALEPALNGKEIAICVEDGDYEVDDSIAAADQRLRSRHPDSVFFYGRVGGDHAVRWGGYARVTPGKG